MLKFSNDNIKIIPLLYIAFVLCTTGLPLYSSGYIFMKEIKPFDKKFIGKKYGQITILEYIGLKNGRKIILGRCECGTEKEYVLTNLTRNHTKSCGCFIKKFCAERFTTHNLSRHPLNSVWDGIKRRCYQKDTDSYPFYGGKGVIMCQEWLNDFKAFYDWAIANGWEKGLQIDKDIIPRKLGIPALLYSPEMCSIVTLQENCDSRSNGRHFIIDNIDYTLLQLSKKYNINYKALFARLQIGWDIHKAINTPIQKQR